MSGKTQEEHDERLKIVFKRLADRNITLGLDKCEFNKPTLTFYGFQFPKSGISSDPQKVAAIAALDIPLNASEARSLLSMTHRAVANITEPIRRLTQKSVEWKWTDKQENAFQRLKQALSDSPVVGYFNPDKQTDIVMDASPVGVSAILRQYDSKPEDGYVVAYASRALSSVEQRYPQTDREGLAVVWGCEHFHLYIYGRPVTVVTDHKPLLGVFNNPKYKPPVRLERYANRLDTYQATVVYRSGADNPADYMSCHLLTGPHADPEDEDAGDLYVNFIATHAVPKAMRIDEIKSATLSDSTLQEVASRVHSGWWHDPYPKGVDPTALSSLRNVRDELAVLPDNDLILRGHRIVMPAALQAHIITIVHEGHLGMVKTKQLLREKVWFPGIDKQVEHLVKSCLPCQAVTKNPEPKPELLMPELPDGPWRNLCADFWGPTPDGKYVLVIVDEYSRYPVVDIINSTAGSTVMPVFDKYFSMIGIPEVLKTDNGPPFNGDDFARFTDYLGFDHRKITPLWPQSNAEGERFMPNVEKAVFTPSLEGKSWKK